MTLSLKSLVNLATNTTLTRAFREQKECVKTVFNACESMLCTDEKIPESHKVTMGKLTRDHLSFRKNVFSTLFLAVYHALEFKPAQRLLFGQFNQLFRVWVTSADNILDNEDKVTLPIQFPHESKLMVNIVALMTADRVLHQLLSQALDRKVVTREQAEAIERGTLQVLLPSAAQEASEEAGVETRPPPEEVLNTIHRFKTGILFHIPFLGPDIVGVPSDMQTRMDGLKTGLMDFGLGCQALDDIRDMGRDLVEKRHNLLLSTLASETPETYDELLETPTAKIPDRLYSQFPELTRKTAEYGQNQIRSGLDRLGKNGLGISPALANELSKKMFDILDIKDIQV
jgi:hypothetical protein